ncbi:MAG: hypothetical protein IPH63_17800 [Flavobacteriales bacterium]|nr:hypothetical protein [Flavobacteriales bacterium]
MDACGVCYAGGASNPLWNTTCADCAGVPNGTAFLDNCNECVGGTTGLDPCTDDCLGVPGGNAEVDAAEYATLVVPRTLVEHDLR